MQQSSLDSLLLDSNPARLSTVNYEGWPNSNICVFIAQATEELGIQHKSCKYTSVHEHLATLSEFATLSIHVVTNSKDHAKKRVFG